MRNTVAITNYSTSGQFECITSYCFNNAQNGDCFRVIFQTNLPSQHTIIPVVVHSIPNNTNISLLCSRNGNQIMSDQLVGVHKLCCTYGSNNQHFLVQAAYDKCGRRMCLKPSAYYGTNELIPAAATELLSKAASGMGDKKA